MKSVLKFLLLFISTTAAASIRAMEQESPIAVELEMAGNSVVTARLTNTGQSNLKVLKHGSLLDSRPIEKVAIFSGCKCKEGRFDF